MRAGHFMTIAVFSLTFVAVAVAHIPASVLAASLAQRVPGLVLANSQGTLWQGSAEAVLQSGPSAAGVLPGQLNWNLTPTLHGMDVVLDEEVQGASVSRLTGIVGWHSVHINAGQVALPAELLMGLGAPFNTLRFEGALNVEWNALDWAYGAAAPDALLSVTVHANQLRSRLSSVAPLGSYTLTTAWGPLGGRIDLETVSGPLMLSGQGTLTQGRLGFDGQATASDDMQPQLIGLLSILGKREGAITRLHY
jgi:general secretion pathway protein N